MSAETPDEQGGRSERREPGHRHDGPHRILWHEPVLLATGPGRYRLLLPVVGHPPTGSALDFLLARLTARCEPPHVAADDIRLRVLRAEVEPLGGLRSRIAVAVEASPPADDARRVMALIRTALRGIALDRRPPDSGGLAAGPGAPSR